MHSTWLEFAFHWACQRTLRSTSWLRSVGRKTLEHSQAMPTRTPHHLASIEAKRRSNCDALGVCWEIVAFEFSHKTASTSFKIGHWTKLYVLRTRADVLAALLHAFDAGELRGLGVNEWRRSCERPVLGSAKLGLYKG